MKIKHIILITISTLILLTCGIIGYNKYFDSSIKIGADGFVNKKNLIVYYSTENMDKIAQNLHSKIGGDIIKLEPVVAYPQDKEKYIERLKTEKRSKKPILIKNIPNVEDYDLIFVGTPIELYTLSPIIKSFLKEPELNGKIVLPFISYEYSGGARNILEFKKILGENTTVKNGLIIQKDGGNSLNTRITMWLNSIKFTRRELKNMK